MDQVPERASNQDESPSSIVPERGMSTSRRGFLIGAASAPLAAGLVSGGMLPWAMTSASAAGQNYSVNRVGLLMDDDPAGLLRSADGGEAYAEVILEPGEIFDSKSHSSPTMYEDIVIQTSANMNNQFYDWIASTWEGKVEHPQNGSIVTFDYDYKPKAMRNFHEGMITETTFPEMDAASKDNAFLSINVAPSSTEVVGPSGQDYTQGKTRKWLVSNFKLDIPGLDCTKINKIDAFTVKSTHGETPKVEFSNLVITMAVSGAESWNKWYRKSVVLGAPTELSGQLSTYDATMSQKQIHIDLEGLGIVRLGPAKLVAGSEAIARVVAELYVERMHFNGPPR
jgi:T4-like virus tail tube protein gp19